MVPQDSKVSGTKKKEEQFDVTQNSNVGIRFVMSDIPILEKPSFQIFSSQKQKRMVSTCWFEDELFHFYEFCCCKFFRHTLQKNERSQS